MQIKGRTFIVTGGSSGLGAATVAELLKRGANVVIADLQEPDDKSLADTADRVLFVKVDITSKEDVLRAIQLASSKFGASTLGGVVNSAGIFRLGKIVSSNGTPLVIEDFAHVVKVNLIGTVNVSSLVASHLAKQRPNQDGERGVIINVASIAGIEGPSGQIAYSASKGGVASLTMPMARDLARHGIRVLTIAPGIFGTSMASSMPERSKEYLIKQVEFPRRLGRNEEFAQLAAHMIENSYLNGEVVRLDAAIRLGKL